MKKINFIIALSLLCCSCDSMGFRNRTVNQISTNGGNRHIHATRKVVNSQQMNVQNRLAVKQNTRHQTTQQAYPRYISPTTNTDHLAGINLGAVVVKESRREDLELNGAKFALFEVTDRSGKNPGGNSCGYNALHTTRFEVFNVMSYIFHQNIWDMLSIDDRNCLSYILNSVISEWGQTVFDVSNEGYIPAKHWEALYGLMRKNIYDPLENNSGTTMDINLAALICYIRGENLVVISPVYHNRFQEHIYNESWVTRYLYNPGGHWQELRQYQP